MNADLLKNLPPKLAAILEAAKARGATVSVRRITGGVEAEVAGDKALRDLFGAFGLDMDKEAARAREARRNVALDMQHTLRGLLYDAKVFLADLERRQADPKSDEFLNAIQRRIALESLMEAFVEGAKACECESCAEADQPPVELRPQAADHG